MTCHEMDEYLDDWVDETLSEARKREVGAHLAVCADCQRQERRLRSLLTHAAALPRSMSPPRDLWPGVAERIGRRRRWSWAGLGTWQPALAAAAIVVIALVAVLLARPSPSRVRPVVVHGPELTGGEASRPHPAALEMDPGLAAMEQDYQAAANALLEALVEQKDGLEPGTLESVQRNLAVIDEALAEVHRALEKDPNRPELGRMLVSTHRKRVDVLRKMVKLSTTLEMS
jgi:hypothetical protein